MTDKYNKLMEDLDPYLLEVKSDEGQELINKSKKVYELWSDSEITSTKAGSLYNRRSALHVSYNFIPKGDYLWDGKKYHHRKLITDIDKVVEIIKTHFPNYHSMYYRYLKKLQQALTNN